MNLIVLASKARRVGAVYASEAVGGRGEFVSSTKLRATHAMQPKTAVVDCIAMSIAHLTVNQRHGYVAKTKVMVVSLAGLCTPFSYSDLA